MAGQSRCIRQNRRKDGEIWRLDQSEPKAIMLPPCSALSYCGDQHKEPPRGTNWTFWSPWLRRMNGRIIPLICLDPIEAIIEAIKFRLEQEGKDYKALIGVIGQRTRVYEVMRGARPLSLNMIRNLYRKLEIPAAVLIQAAPAKKPRTARRVPMKQTGPHRSGRRSV
jgi:hypothetical protein